MPISLWNFGLSHHPAFPDGLPTIPGAEPRLRLPLPARSGRVANLVVERGQSHSILIGRVGVPDRCVGLLILRLA